MGVIDAGTGTITGARAARPGARWLRHHIGWSDGLSRIFFVLLIVVAVSGNVSALEPFQESAGQVVMEAENYDAKIARSGRGWNLALSPTPGYSGTSYLQCLPNSGGLVNTGYKTTSPELQYQIHFTTTGTYSIWIRGKGPTTNDDSVHAGVDGTTPTSADRIGNFPNSWTWSRNTLDGAPATIIISTAGIHTFNIWAREDGFIIDKILLRTSSSSTAPSGTGPPESPRGGTNHVPSIASLTPQNGSKYYEQEGMTVTVNASDLDGDALQYQFSLNGVVKQSWGATSTYSLVSGDRNFGKRAIEVSVRDGRGGETSASTTIFFYKRPLEP